MPTFGSRQIKYLRRTYYAIKRKSFRARNGSHLSPDQVLDLSSTANKWNIAEDSNDDSGSSIADRVTRSLAAFGVLSQAVTTLATNDTHSLQSAFIECNGRFRVWSGNIGAHHVSGKASLDYRLRDATYIKTRFVRLLQDLNQLLGEGAQYL